MLHKLTTLFETLANTFPFLTFLFMPYYKAMVASEVSLASLKDRDHVLCIGGGPLPLTALLINKETNAHITILDVDQRACQKAQKLIDKLNLKNTITVVHGCGKTVDLKPYSVVHIAKQVSPKSCVLTHVKTHATKDTKVLVRYGKKHDPFSATVLTHTRKWVKSTCLYVV